MRYLPCIDLTFVIMCQVKQNNRVPVYVCKRATRASSAPARAYLTSQASRVAGCGGARCMALSQSKKKRFPCEGPLSTSSSITIFHISSHFPSITPPGRC
jgi:hypothetical protein